MLDRYEAHLAKKKVGYIRIDGGVDAEKRHERVTRFQHSEDVRVAVLSITACSQGLTLTAASTVVFAEMYWTPSIMSQAEDRAHRISQQNCVNVYYLYGPATVDDIVFRMLNMKSEVISDTLDGQARNHQLDRASKDECIKAVKTLKEKGQLNPVMKPMIVNRKKENKITEFFDSKKPKQSFVSRESGTAAREQADGPTPSKRKKRRPTAARSGKQKAVESEEIEESDDED